MQADERRPIMTVEFPPVERTLTMIFCPDGTLRAVELDGTYYAATRRKRMVWHREGDTVVSVVKPL